MDGGLLAASVCWISVAWASNTGGSLGILGITEWGARKGAVPLIHAHSSQLTEAQWNPYNPWQLATGASDGLVRLWNLPENGLTGDWAADKASATLSGHGKRVDAIAWHPSAVNVLAASGADNAVHIWDTSACAEKLKISKFTDLIDGLAWNYEGNFMVTSSRDKKIRIIDPRADSVAQEVGGHMAAGRPSKVAVLGRTNRVVTTGFTQTRDREMVIRDIRQLSKVLKQQGFDSSPGVQIPLYDMDTDLLFLSGRGDSSIRTFEMVEDNSVVFELNPVVDKTAHRGITMVPKLACDLMGAEVARILRATNNAIVPVGFSIPRKTYRDFHADLFPDTLSDDPALNQDQFFAGETKAPLLRQVKPPAGVEVAAAEPAKPASGSSSPALGASSSSTPASSQPSSGSNSPAQPRSVVAPGKAHEPKVYRPHAISVSGASSDHQVTTEDGEEYYVPKDISIVRSTHFRHIFGKVANRVDCYEDLKILNDAMQTHTIRANKTWFAVTWQGVGGRLAVLNVAKDKGRVQPPIQKGKTDADATKISTIEAGSPLIDFDFNPHNDNLVATGTENALIKLWKIPEEGIKTRGSNLTDAEAILRGHNHKIVTVDFHPFAQNLLATTSGDLSCKLWDIEAQKDVITLKGFNDLVQSVAFSYDGSLIALASKDRAVRIYDPRANKVVLEQPDVGGPQGSRVDFMGKKDQFVCVGANKMSERQLQTYDLRAVGKPLADVRIDQGSGLLTPSYDPDTGVVLLWGKGETSVKFFELNDIAPFAHPLTDYTTTIPQVGIAVLPKTTCDVREVEIFRAFKLTQDTVEPTGFRVPRQKKEYFQDDIIPPTASTEATTTAAKWFGGDKTGPKMVDLRPADMKPLSEAPKVVRLVRKVKAQEEDDFDLEKVKNRLVDKFHEQMLAHKEDEEDDEPGKDLDGCDSDEWD